MTVDLKNMHTIKKVVFTDAELLADLEQNMDKSHSERVEKLVNEIADLDLSSKRLVEIFKSETSTFVRIAVVSHPQCPKELLTKVSNDSDPIMSAFAKLYLKERYK
jgi:hypothetical protein